jgi:hypothetical protein
VTRTEEGANVGDGKREHRLILLETHRFVRMNE